jgi:hypothetical protein
MGYFNVGDKIDIVTSTLVTPPRRNINIYGGVTQQFRGLHVRTHPNRLVSSSRVWMTADEICMDDGSRMNFPTPYEADIVNSGAGGLDTGVETLSTWYEIYAIGKDDNTRALMLHQAKDYFLDQQQTVNDGSYRVRGTTQLKLAQSFQLTTPGIIEFVDIAVHRTGTPTGTIWLTIEADNAGSPSGVALATSDKMLPQAVYTSSQYLRFVFRAPFAFSSGVPYHLVLQGDYTASDVNAIYWRADVAGVYANGNVQYTNDGLTWIDVVADDFVFKIYVTRNDSDVVMPTGYIKKAKVGYVYNTAAGNFRGFVSKDRRSYGYASSPVLSTTAIFPTLTDLSAIVPPGMVTIYGQMSSSVNNDVVVISGIPEGFSIDLAQTPYMSANVAPSQNYDNLVTECQGFYAYRFTGTGTINVYVFGYEW